ncbi:MAG: adenylate kinase [Chloroflexi bacterium]|nr:adenylate kinase [Chloroflexota bacterium]
MTKHIVLLGPPGAGKGTQAKNLSKSLSLMHVSSGDIFREHMHEETKLGQMAANYINKGELVPDDVTIAMIRERLSRPDCNSGALLDGFPRTPHQADALDAILIDLNKGPVNAVPFIEVPDDILVERLTGRWTCRAHGHIFHLKFNPPQVAGKCDYDGSELFQRKDDLVETVTNRIRVYYKQTQPLIDYYRQRGLLLDVNGAQEIESVFSDLLTALSDI